jgi:hypothetical protein
MILPCRGLDRIELGLAAAAALFVFLCALALLVYVQKPKLCLDV